MRTILLMAPVAMMLAVCWASASAPVAPAGDAEVKDKLLKSYTIGDMTYKVHLDGYNLVPYLTGEAEKSPRVSFIYCNDDQQVVALRAARHRNGAAAGHRQVVVHAVVELERRLRRKGGRELARCGERAVR